MKLITKSTVTSLLIIASIFSGFGQDSNTILRKLEDLYGTNSLLVNGGFYYEHRPLAVGSPYFEDDIKKDGTIYIAGKCFNNELIRYNIDLDQLILTLAEEKSEREIILVASRVDSFFMNDHSFINTSHINDSVFNSFNYIEKIANQEYGLFITHSKVFKKQYDVYSPNGLYSKDNKHMYVRKGDVFYEISRNRHLLALFPAFKQKLRRYFRSKNIKIQKVGNEQLLGIMAYIHELSH